MQSKMPVISLVFLSIILLSGCTETTVTPSTLPTITPSPIIIPSPAPTITPNPPEGKHWVALLPKQCAEMAWGADSMPSTADSLERLNQKIFLYYRGFGIQVYEISRTKTEGTSCAACGCSSGYKIGLLVSTDDANKIGETGIVTITPMKKLNVTFEYTCNPIENNSAIVQIKSPTKFYIRGNFQNACFSYEVHWRINEKALEIEFKSIPSTTGCMKCVGRDEVNANLDVASETLAYPLEKIIVKYGGEVLAEKVLNGAFCGGIAGFPCPSGYECRLDGSYPDAGGKCALNNGGILQGKVSIGPICPVERPDQPCPVPPEAYAARKLTATGPNGQEKIAIIDIKSDGTYSIDLAPGTYVIGMQQNGIDRSAQLPATVEIKAGTTTTLNVDIDTGIR
ncbi:MAG: hypothetical protein V1835_00045 [Candidatus Micrarchaeota archaeon]